MNLIFDKTNLQVLSVFDDIALNNSPAEILKQMFPADFRSLFLWHIDRKINYNPVHLSIQLDSDKNPDILLFRGKQIYKCSDEEKKKRKAVRLEEGKKALGLILPRRLRASVDSEIIKLWVNYPSTYPSIAKGLSDFSYFSEKKILPVSWWGPFTDAGGYANMNREIIFRLHNYHVIAKADICPTAPQISPVTQYRLSKYRSLDLSRIKNCPSVWSFTPIPHPRHSGKNVFFTMMETETLHPEFARICNVYSDEIWVPSKHNKRVFKEAGIKKPIVVMPLGIDKNLYTQNDNSPLGMVGDNVPFVDLLGKSHKKNVNSFRFLSLFGWSYRKGVDVLIKSFVNEFNSKDDVALIIVARHSGSPAQDT